MKNKGDIIGTIAIIAVVLVIAGIVGTGVYHRMQEDDADIEDEEIKPEEGTYIGFSDANEYGYVKAEVEMENGNITNVELTEVDEAGFEKDEDYDWEEFHEAMEVLPERFAEADDHDVEIVTGATDTSNKAIQAVERAMRREEGYEEPFDGTFFGASEITDRDVRNIAWVTVEDGEIIEVELEEYYNVTEKELKDEDYDWEEFHEAMEVLPERFVEADDHDVEIVTGATGSTERWSTAVRRALQKAGVKN